MFRRSMGVWTDLGVDEENDIDSLKLFKKMAMEQKVRNASVINANAHSVVARACKMAATTGRDRISYPVPDELNRSRSVGVSKYEPHSSS